MAPPPRLLLLAACAVVLLGACLPRAAATPAGCAPGCDRHGTCYAPLGRCDCPRGFAGADCSRHALPSCTLDAARAMRSGCLGVSTCACLLECEANGFLSMEVNFCWNYSAASPVLEDVIRAPLLVYGTTEVVEDGMINSAAAPRADAWRAAPKEEAAAYLPLSECAGNCTARGLCKRDRWGAQLPRCVCFDGYGGDRGACEEAVGHKTMCMGQCSGRGRCKDGWCHCALGAYGADCSLTGGEHETLFWEAEGAASAAAGAAATALPAAGAASASSDGALRPRIYVYELPPRFNTWFSPVAPARNLGVQLHERLLSSRYRTTDMGAADYFYVPVSPMGQQNHYNAVRAARWVAAAYPRVWARRKGADHLFAFPWDFGACWVGGHPALNNSIFLTHFGLDRTLKEYACECALCAPSYTPGKDVVLPDTFELGDKVNAASLRAGGAAAAKPPAPARTTKLFFGGGRTGPAREQLFNAQLAGEGVRIVEGHVELAKEMSTSVFCLSAPGAGFGTRAVLAIVHGCIPVSFVDAVHEPFEDVVDFDAIGVRIKQAQLGSLVSMLDAISPADVAAKQAQLACVAPHFVWSSITGALGDEDGSGDAFETLMYALRRRLPDLPGPHPRLSCATVGVPGAPPPLRPLWSFRRGGFRGDNRPWPMGGAACNLQPERPC